MYVNAREVLPPELLKKVQHYVQGVQLYVPNDQKTRCPWGAHTGTREELRRRNQMITAEYGEGASVLELAADYHLSEDSVRRIVRLTRKEQL